MEQSIDIEMYVLTDPEVVAALERAEGRGVAVRVILDPNQAGNQQHVERLKEHGVEVKWFPITKPAQMHRKLALVDGKQILAGSVNWTANGLERNAEVMFLVEDAPTVQQVEHVFADDWYRAWLGYDPAATSERAPTTRAARRRHRALWRHAEYP